MPPHHTRLKTRRQNHSCDQCRKSKRACDARRTEGRPAPPCSYCARTKKRCTMEWARSQAQSKSKRQSISEEDNSINMGYGFWDTLIPEDVMAWNVNLDIEPPGLSYQTEAEAETETTHTQTEISDALALSDLIPDFSSMSDLDLDLDVCNQTWLSGVSPGSLFPESPRRRLSDTSASPAMCTNTSTSTNTNMTMPRTSSLSPFSIDQQMITASNSHLTSANLLQIYHDVLEHNLSCWVAEMTCPYQPVTASSAGVGVGAAQLAPPEWGSSWSNRVYQRTIKLDRVAQTTKIVRLTRAEDQAASKALHLAIMAFATQWAQGSARHRERYPSGFGCVGHAEEEITDEFDRVIQNHFWDQAHRALQRVADLESYRVAGAEIIFGLTQRPYSSRSQRAESEVESKPGVSDKDRGGSTTDLVLSEVREIINRDGPPRYIESAARKMHALKYRCDMMEKGGGGGDRTKLRDMDCEDRASVGLLYWLAIMFDTVSASMNERPIVVLDEDCQHEAQKETSEHDATASRWKLDLFVPGGLGTIHETHWPCSYDTAAEDITKSAPVKVLLFRHVSYLQNAIRKGLPQADIEDIIQSTHKLYEYWNKTHGAFFRELVQDYNAVPQRIQGWFVCISAHWHLAVLLLADLLEFVVDNEPLVQSYRKQSASELADLARVATPPARDVTLGVPQMPDFHHAVNQGTLLTEPWTMILIRAFTKACVIFLREIEALPGSTHDVSRNMTQAEDCIKGLWLLGKKSDMAREIAESLSRALPVHN